MAAVRPRNREIFAATEGNLRWPQGHPRANPYPAWVAVGLYRGVVTFFIARFSVAITHAVAIRRAVPRQPYVGRTVALRLQCGCPRVLWIKIDFCRTQTKLWLPWHGPGKRGCWGCCSTPGNSSGGAQHPLQIFFGLIYLMYIIMLRVRNCHTADSHK